ncbi:MAG: B12-binding domain-containing radical SAM protein [Candidatus Bathyarchaeum sp.]|nr:MAG: B12-binding domain-containing radical SAM protein [Candidatus Bathyarchaeum sp.]
MKKKPLGYVNLSTIPLGLGYIAAALELDGVYSTIIDMNFLEMKTNDLKQRIEQVKPNIVGISSMSSNYQNAVDVAKSIKSWFPETTIVLGGVHATFMYEEILNSVPEIDVIVRYEGEITFSQLVKTIENRGDLKTVKGIAFRDENRKVVTTPQMELVEDLDSLPFPAYHLIEPTVEEYIGKHKIRAFPLLTTRGCPYDCIFCSTTALHGRKYRTRSVSNIIEHIEYLIDTYRINTISFADDNFTMQQDRIFELCNQIKKHNLSIQWGCSTRTDLLSTKLLRKMKEAGCNNLFFGIESASEKVLKIIKKGVSIAHSKKIVKQAEKLGIKTHCSFILGLPGETSESLNDIIKFIKETKPTGRVLPNLLENHPGTELYQTVGKQFNQSQIPFPDIAQTQIEMLLTFYKQKSKTDELIKVIPPDIVVK